jgi:hypothetical protein
MQHQVDKDRAFAPEEMVNASELKDFLFCHLAWFLNQQGFRNTPRAIEERRAGIAFHEDRAEAARKLTAGKQSGGPFFWRLWVSRSCS